LSGEWLEGQVSGESGVASGGYTGTERILALSDGVFAVAITLLVLDLLPAFGAAARPPALGAFLHDKLASYLSYVLSFLTIGVIWTNHHQMFTQIKRSNHVFLLLNIVFLLWVAVLPFPAALLAQYLGQNGPDHKDVVTTFPAGHPLFESNAAMAIYAGTYVVGSVLFNAVWWYGIRNRRLMGDDADRAAVRRTTWSYYVGPIAYVLDLVLSLFSVGAGLGLFLALAIFYALAPLPRMDRLTAPRRARV